MAIRRKCSSAVIWTCLTLQWRLPTCASLKSAVALLQCTVCLRWSMTDATSNCLSWPVIAGCCSGDITAKLAPVAQVKRRRCWTGRRTHELPLLFSRTQVARSAIPVHSMYWPEERCIDLLTTTSVCWLGCLHVSEEEVLFGCV